MAKVDPPNWGNLIGDRTPRHQKAVKLTNRRVCQRLQFPIERTNSMRKVREHVFRRHAQLGRIGSGKHTGAGVHERAQGAGIFGFHATCEQ